MESFSINHTYPPNLPVERQLRSGSDNALGRPRNHVSQTTSGDMTPASQKGRSAGKEIQSLRQFTDRLLQALARPDDSALKSGLIW